MRKRVTARGFGSRCSTRHVTALRHRRRVPGRDVLPWNRPRPALPWSSMNRSHTSSHPDTRAVLTSSSLPQHCAPFRDSQQPATVSDDSPSAGIPRPGGLAPRHASARNRTLSRPETTWGPKQGVMAAAPGSTTLETSGTNCPPRKTAQRCGCSDSTAKPAKPSSEAKPARASDAAASLLHPEKPCIGPMLADTNWTATSGFALTPLQHGADHGTRGGTRPMHESVPDLAFATRRPPACGPLGRRGYSEAFKQPGGCGTQTMPLAVLTRPSP